MRKQDYATLASIVREKINEARDIHNPHMRAYALSVLREIADQFAQSASVNKTAFLKACGID